MVVLLHFRGVPALSINHSDTWSRHSFDRQHDKKIELVFLLLVEICSSRIFVNKLLKHIYVSMGGNNLLLYTLALPVK